MKSIKLIFAMGLMLLGGMMNSVSAQEIGAWKGFKSGAATFTFLQNAPCHVTYVAPLFDSYGYEASFYLTTSTVTNWSDWQGVADNGHEIGSYGMTNSSLISASELTGSKSAINSHITGQNCITVSYPNCQRPGELSTLQANYIAGSDCSGGVISGAALSTLDTYQIPKIMTGNQGINSATQITSKMQEAINSKGWAVFMTFGIQGHENGYATYSPTSPDALRGALMWAEDNGNIWVSSLRNVKMYIDERLASTFALQSETMTAATYSLTHSLDNTVCDYDYPLSLRVPLQGWTDIEVKQDGNVIPHTEQDDYIYFDAVPNGGTIVISHAPAAFKEIYAVADGTKMVLYYDTQKSSRANVVAGWTPEQGTSGMNFDELTAFTIVELDASMQAARPTSTSGWFYWLPYLTSIEGLAYLNTSEVTNMAGMFEICESLTSLDLSGFNTANVTDMAGMFQACESLTSLDLSSFNTANVTNTAGMFQGCESLTTIYCDETWNPSSSDDMFDGCTSLVGGKGTVYDAAHKDATYARPDKGASEPGYFTGPAETPKEIYAALSGSTMTLYFDDQKASRPGVLAAWTTAEGTSFVPEETRNSITKAVIDPSMVDASPTSTPAWFYGLYNLTTIEGFANLNTSEVEYMGYMFSGCSSLTSLDLSSFNTANVTDMYAMFQDCESLTSLDLSSFNTANVTDMYTMFSGCSSLTSLDLSSFNTANVTNTAMMFRGCESLSTIYCDETWNPSSSDDMFDGCTSLVGGKGTVYDAAHEDATYARPDKGASEPGYFTGPAEPEIYAVADGNKMVLYYDTQKSSRENLIAGWIPEQGTNNMTDEERAAITSVELDASMQEAQPTKMEWWFAKLSNVTNILHLDYLNTSEVTSMYSMFYECTSLTSLDLSHFNTSKVQKMGQLFLDCNSLTELNLSSFNTSNVTEMLNMFGSCSSLTTLDLSHFNTAKVTMMTQMFDGCSSLTTIYCNDEWNPSTSGHMFYGCTSLVGGKGTVYDPGHVNAAYARPDKGASEPGYFTGELIEPEVYTVFNSSTGVLTYYYDDQKDSREGIVEVYDPDIDRFADYHEQVTKAVIDASMQEAPLTSMEYMFYGGYASLSNMTTIEGIENLNTSNVTSMSYMFYSCTSLTSLDLSSFNTENVTSMSGMFHACTSLSSLNISSFNTAKVTNMDQMFGYCRLTSLDLSHFNTANVTSMYNMFYDCTSLKSLDISNFNTAKVTNMEGMFYICGVTSLDLSSFNTENVKYMDRMFASCSFLTSLDLSNFNISKVENMEEMFTYCINLTTIYCNEDWSQSPVLENSENMFDDCTSLVGGKGTTYDAAHKDAAYARPDKTGQAGYFTLSPEKAVEELIDAIGEVEYTAESKAKIDEARAGYDALTKAQKEKVSNYDVLKAAEALYLALKMEAEYAEAIAEVEGECEYTINLVTPGTFAIAMVEAMGDHTWVDVHHLCVSGPMNDDDLSYLAQCVNMVTLSLRNAQFETYGASKNWKSLEKILLPPTCKTLKKEAFYRCEKLNYINLGEVETFGEEAFYYCELLPEVDLHSAKTLDHRVFEYCTGLTTVSMPEVTYIGTQCFVGCSNLVSASMPKATTIGGSAFGYLTKLKQVELCDDIEKFEGGEFYGCSALSSVKLPSKLRYIGSNTFTNIIEVDGEWPKGIEYIGSGNFAKMDYMVIGPNVTQIWVASNKWQNIYCYAADPQAVVSKYNPFTASNVGNTTLYVPRSSLSAYKLNQAYANFLHIYALDDDIDLLHIYSPYTMLSTDRITEDAQLILHPDAALKTSAPSPLKVGSYEQYIHLGPKQYTSQTVTEDGVQVTHYYSYLHHTGILHANSPLSSDEVTVHLIPMHKQWNFITLPFDVSVQDIAIWTRGTGTREDGVPGVSQYVFREYSGANRASGTGATWVNVPEDGVLQANKGYILYWAVEGGTSQTNYYPGTLSDEFIYYFRMPAMHTENHSNIFATGDVQVPLTHYSSEFPQNVSWNLIGNPYPCMYDIRQTDFDATMTMWNGTAYVAYSPIDDPYTLRPGEAFFVQAPDEVDAITFHEEGRYDATKIEIDQNAYQLHMMPTRTRVAGGRTLYNFLLSGDNYSDRARLVINPSASEAYDLHRDAAKMLSTDAGVPQLWIEEDGVRYAINECPAQDSYRMGAFIASDGEYRITLVSDDTENTVWLTDLATNTVTNLSQGAYTFTAEAGMYAGRFLITFGANAPTHIENGEDGTLQGTKLLIDGQLIIITPQGKRFNANGVEL